MSPPAWRRAARPRPGTRRRGPAPVRSDAADGGGPLAHAEQPVPRPSAPPTAGPRPRRAGPGPLSLTRSRSESRAVAQFDVDRGARRVPPGVGQRLLHDPVGGQLDARVERRDRAGDDQPGARPRGLPGAVDQLGQLRQPRLRMPVADGVVRRPRGARRAAAASRSARPGRCRRSRRAAAPRRPAARAWSAARSPPAPRSSRCGARRRRAARGRSGPARRARVLGQRSASSRAAPAAPPRRGPPRDPAPTAIGSGRGEQHGGRAAVERQREHEDRHRQRGDRPAARRRRGRCGAARPAERRRRAGRAADPAAASRAELAITWRSARPRSAWPKATSTSALPR